MITKSGKKKNIPLIREGFGVVGGLRGSERVHAAVRLENLSPLMLSQENKRIFENRLTKKSSQQLDQRSRRTTLIINLGVKMLIFRGKNVDSDVPNRISRSAAHNASITFRYTRLNNAVSQYANLNKFKFYLLHNSRLSTINDHYLKE